MGCQSSRKLQFITFDRLKFLLAEPSQKKNRQSIKVEIVLNKQKRVNEWLQSDLDIQDVSFSNGKLVVDLPQIAPDIKQYMLKEIILSILTTSPIKNAEYLVIEQPACNFDNPSMQNKLLEGFFRAICETFIGLTIRVDFIYLPQIYFKWDSVSITNLFEKYDKLFKSYFTLRNKI